MKIKRPKTIYVLLVLFGWLLSQDIGLFLNYSSSIDYLLFAHVGASSVFPIVLALITIFHALTIYFLWKPSVKGFWVIAGGVVISSLEEIFISTIGLMNLEVFRTAIIANREAQSLPAPEGTVNTLASTGGLYVAIGFSIAVAIVILSLLLWKRSYFYSQSVDKKTSHQENITNNSDKNNPLYR